MGFTLLRLIFVVGTLSPEVKRRGSESAHPSTSCALVKSFPCVFIACTGTNIRLLDSFLWVKHSLLPKGKNVRKLKCSREVYAEENTLQKRVEATEGRRTLYN